MKNQMIATFFDGVDVHYHHAKFREYILGAKIWCMFVCFILLAVPLAAPEVCPSCFQLVNRSSSHGYDVIIYFHVRRLVIPQLSSA